MKIESGCFQQYCGQWPSSIVSLISAKITDFNTESAVQCIQFIQSIYANPIQYGSESKTKVLVIVVI